MSDYCVLHFDCQLQAVDRQYQNKFRVDKGDYEHLCEFLNIDWDKFLDYAHSSIDEMWDKFKVLIMEGINKFMPKAGLHRTNAKKDFQPFTKELQQLVHQKHQLWKRWIISKDEAMHRQYKIIRNKVKIEIIKVAEQDQRKVAIDCKKNPKRVGNILIRRLSKNK